jgi:hypothetical protein
MAEAAWAAITRGDRDLGVRVLQRSIEAQRSGARYAAAAYTYLSTFWWSDPTNNYAIAKAGLEAAEAAGDVLGAVGSRITLSAQAMVTGHDDEALDQAGRALTEARRLGQPTLEAGALLVSGLALSNADPAQAITLLRESVDLTERFGIESERVSALSLIAALEARHGDARRALEALRAEIVSPVPWSWNRSDLYIGLQVFNRVGRPDLVARCYGVSRRVYPSAPAFFRKLNDDAIEEARAAVGNEVFDAYAAEGATITPDQLRDALQREIDELLAATDRAP